MTGTVQVGVRIPRPVLDERIEQRVRRMWADGLVEEVRRTRRRRGLRDGPYRQAGARLPAGAGVPRRRVHRGRRPSSAPWWAPGASPGGRSRGSVKDPRITWVDWDDPARWRLPRRRCVPRLSPGRLGRTSGSVRDSEGTRHEAHARAQDRGPRSGRGHRGRRAGTGPVTVQARSQATPDPFYTTKVPTSRGFGGAVTSVDPEASRVGLNVLKNGGNAVDAAVATAAALGVTEPYSSGLGGGGYFVYYNAKTHKVRTIDGRETAPKAMPHDAFIDKSTGKPYNFTPELVTSGVSVGVPGTPATWAKALREWGTYKFDQALEPAAALARRGFKVDKTFRQQTLDNQKRFEAYTTTPRLFLPGGDAPAVGSVFRNPALARTYEALRKRGVSWFYNGPIAREIARQRAEAAEEPEHDLPVPAGYITAGDLARYRALFRAPTVRRLPRLRRLRHGRLVLRRHHRR